MVNQQMIDDWRRGQEDYPQARYFTPGPQQTEHGVSGQGRAKAMDLLVVVHNDVPPAAVGLYRVDLIVNQGGVDHAATHGNAHLVNRYDEQAGITDHTEVYTEHNMNRIRRGGSRPVNVQDPEGGEGSPGAEIRSVRAKLHTNQRGELMIDSGQSISPGSGASVDTLHDVQESMNQAAQRDRTAAQRELMPDLDHSVPAEANGLSNSQAGLAAAQGPKRSYSSVPRPGEPGSRFNPRVRERPVQTAVQPQNPDLIDSSDVPKDGATPKPRRDLPSARTMGQFGVGGAQGAAAGLKATAAIPHPAAKAVGAAGGAVIGGVAAVGGKKAMPENTGQTSNKEHQRPKAAEPAQSTQATKLPTGQRFKDSKVGQVVHSEEFRSGAKRVGTEAARDAASEASRVKQSGASNRGVAASAAKGAATGAIRGIRTEVVNKSRDTQAPTPQKDRPPSQRYDYQFEKPAQPGDGEPQPGA